MATLGDIFRAEFPGYAAAHRLRPAAHSAARAIMSCRTAVLGGHAEYCPDEHYVQSHYNSCKHRACPQCRGLEMERWLRRQVSRYALACDYHHVVFTMPGELLKVWRFNRSLFSNAMFHAARTALLTLLEDPQHLGALPGMVGSLHTWGRSGIEHIHVHFLVTAGGWTPGGWKGCAARFFVPYDALRRLYRDELLKQLGRSLARGELVVPASLERAALVAELSRLGEIDWHVRVQDRYEGGQGVLTYFSRYVRGGPISNPQILRYEGGEVQYRYHSHETGQVRTPTLSAWELIRRILEHVPEKGFRVVRYYGLFAQNRRVELGQCRGWLGMAAYEEPEKLTLEAYLLQVKITPVTHCPVCGQRLHRRELQPLRSHSPPRSEVPHAAAA